MTALCAREFTGRRGLEIGGPSPIFSRTGLLPIYPLVGSLDNCNFSAKTIWEGTIREGLTFRFDPDRSPGRQYVSEATRLDGVETGVYDFILASHIIEHVANPLAALRRWLEVMKQQAVLLLIAPRKERTFDHRRPTTSLSHLLADEKEGIREDDLTHLPEILALHDLGRDPAAGDLRAFEMRSRANAENRCLHHHVFDEKLLEQMFQTLGLQVLLMEHLYPYHLIAVVRRG